jgi:hypothetical protein
MPIGHELATELRRLRCLILELQGDGNRRSRQLGVSKQSRWVGPRCLYCYINLSRLYQGWEQKKWRGYAVLRAHVSSVQTSKANARGPVGPRCHAVTSRTEVAIDEGVV